MLAEILHCSAVCSFHYKMYVLPLLSVIFPEGATRSRIISKERSYKQFQNKSLITTCYKQNFSARFKLFFLEEKSEEMFTYKT